MASSDLHLNSEMSVSSQVPPVTVQKGGHEGHGDEVEGVVESRALAQLSGTSDQFGR